MQAGDVRARLDSELGVEVRERFVHEEDRWLADDGPSERDALPLPAGERLGLAIEQLVQAKDLARVRDASFDLVLRRLAQLQPKGEVVIDAHVRIERVALEDHRDVAVLGGDVVHDPVADQEPAVADLLQSGHAAQRCRLATSGRSHQDQELAIVDLEVEVVHGEDVAGIALDHVVKGHRGHRTMLPPRTREAGERGACPAAS